MHAAAGGVGLLLCQWAAHLGARVIGTVGSDAKVDLAREHGCDEVIVTSRESFPTRLRELTDGRGVPVVYDAVGATTWEGSLDCLRPRGLMVSYGNASGAVPPFAPTLLAQKGSLYLTRPSLTAYTRRARSCSKRQPSCSTWCGQAPCASRSTSTIHSPRRQGAPRAGVAPHHRLLCADPLKEEAGQPPDIRWTTRTSAWSRTR